MVWLELGFMVWLMVSVRVRVWIRVKVRAVACQIFLLFFIIIFLYLLKLKFYDVSIHFAKKIIVSICRFDEIKVQRVVFKN